MSWNEKNSLSFFALGAGDYSILIISTLWFYVSSFVFIILSNICSEIGELKSSLLAPLDTFTHLFGWRHYFFSTGKFLGRNFCGNGATHANHQFLSNTQAEKMKFKFWSYPVEFNWRSSFQFDNIKNIRILVVLLSGKKETVPVNRCAIFLCVALSNMLLFYDLSTKKQRANVSCISICNLWSKCSDSLAENGDKYYYHVLPLSAKVGNSLIRFGVVKTTIRDFMCNKMHNQNWPTGHMLWHLLWHCICVIHLMKCRSNMLIVCVCGVSLPFLLVLLNTFLECLQCSWMCYMRQSLSNVISLSFWQ